MKFKTLSTVCTIVGSLLLTGCRFLTLQEKLHDLLMEGIEYILLIGLIVCCVVGGIGGTLILLFMTGKVTLKWMKENKGERPQTWVDIWRREKETYKNEKDGDKIEEQEKE